MHFQTNIRSIIYAICIAMLFLCQNSFAQTTDDDYVKKRTPSPTANQEDKWQNIKAKTYTGGNIGLQFGTITFINLSPLVGYQFNKYLTAGVGATYNYIRFNNAGNIENHIYGGRVFARFFPLRTIFLHSEYEALNSNWNIIGNRFYIYNLLAGIGYNYQIGNRSYANITALWNLIPGKYAIYNNPIIRVGFNIGI